MTWSILYRGPLSSCNYECTYCPFAKTENTKEELFEDRQKLESFVNWVKSQSQQIRILFTPWGEALHHQYYQEALCRLSHLDHVQRVAIQTNLAAGLSWLKNSNQNKLAFWSTYHPTQVNREQFLKRVKQVLENGNRISVGTVGLKEHFSEIEALRKELPKEVYLWVNAYKSQGEYYSEQEIKLLESLDPHFPTNNRYHLSKGKACQAGNTAFTVDGDGDVRRCHFIKNIIGNIYDSTPEEFLTETPCTNDTCGCHIGYIHLDELKQYEVYKSGLMERIPE